MTHCWPCGSQGHGACVSPKPFSMWIPWNMCMCFTQTLIYTHSLLLSSSLLLEFMLPCLACGIQGYVVLICFNYMLALSSFTFTSYISITTCVCCIIEIQDELGWLMHTTFYELTARCQWRCTQQTQSRWCEHSNLLPGFLQHIAVLYFCEIIVMK